MIIFFKYLLEVSVCIAALYMVYHFFLQQEKLFKLNRGYLLMALITAFMIPFIDVTLPQTKPVYLNLLEQDLINYYLAGEAVNNESSWIDWTWQNLLISIYSIGVLVMLGRFLSSCIKIYFLIRQGEKQNESDYNLILIQENLPVFSFLNYVFLYKDHGYSDKEKAVILAHEAAHIRERHTLDILLMEGCKTLLWFNPMVYLYQRKLKEVHEYLADEAVIESACTTVQYATLMMQEAQKHTARVLPMTHFFHNQIKNRLIMLSKIKQPKQGFKIFLSLPVLVMLFLTFSINGELFSQKETAVQPVETAKKFKGTQTMEVITRTVHIKGIEKPEIVHIPAKAVPGHCYNLIDEATNTWQEIVCHKDMSKTLLTQVNDKLKAEGYTVDPTLKPRSATSETFKVSKLTCEAIRKYQEDNGFQGCGILTISVVESLGLSFEIKGFPVKK